MESEADTAPSADVTVNAYLMLGNIHLAFGDFVRAYAYYEEGLEASRKAGMPDNEIKFLNDLAIVSCYQGNRDKAVKFNEMLADVPAIDKPMQRYLHLITSAYIEKTFGSADATLAKMRQTLSFIDSTGMDRSMKLSAL